MLSETKTYALAHALQFQDDPGLLYSQDSWKKLEIEHLSLLGRSQDQDHSKRLVNAAERGSLLSTLADAGEMEPPISKREGISAGSQSEIHGEHRYELISTTTNKHDAPPTDSGYGSASQGNTAPMEYQVGVESMVNQEVHSSESPGVDAQESDDDTERPTQSERIDLQDTKTMYSDASSLSGQHNSNHISRLAEELYMNTPSKYLEDDTIEEITQYLPELLQAFALKLGYESSDQILRHVMVFIHKNRR